MSDMQVNVDKENLEIHMTREFDAPRDRIYQAHLDAKIVEKWWGPRRYKTKVEKLEPKVGGQWKFVNYDDKENRHVFYGEYKELKEPESITWTFIYEPFPEAVITETVSFEDLPGGKTRLTTISKFPSKEAIEGMTQGGMEEGARETWDRLAELVEKR